MNPQYARSLEKIAEPHSAPASAQKPKPESSWFKTLIFLAVVAAGGYLGWKYWVPIRAAVMARLGTQAPTGRAGRGAGGPAAVTAATATRGTIHVYLEAQGIVTAFNTVTIHTRVDGQIMHVGFVEGQLVQKGDPLIEIDSRPYKAQLDQAKGSLLRDQALLTNARLDLERYKDAYKNGGAVPQQEVATQEALVQQDQGIVESDQSQVDAANVNLIYCHVTSPLTGRIGLRLVDEGNIVHAADAGGVAVITQLQPIAVIFNLPEDDLDQVVPKPNGGVGLAIDVYDRDDQQKLASGTVLALDNEVDTTNGTFKVKGSFANEDNALFPNQFVNAHLLVNTLRNLVIVPEAAVQHGPDGGSFVYVVDPDQTVEIRNVTEGQSEGNIEAVTGVQPGDIVVTDGTDKLQNGSKVTVTMMEATGATTRPTTRGSGRRGRRGGAGGGIGGGGGARGATTQGAM
jgi:membrane fusion protein, multidrug efflux system